ncbi:dehydration-induced protein [Striga asiatica]|uniref:Dehydration-induced protein n=1 Tax=Striga asiatica TaxID=4170 RepID=A0A5A7NYU3_STRAF|nr:dehydration-induced protein [Striga asiatica]
MSYPLRKEFFYRWAKVWDSGWSKAHLTTKHRGSLHKYPPLFLPAACRQKYPFIPSISLSNLKISSPSKSRGIWLSKLEQVGGQPLTPHLQMTKKKEKKRKSVQLLCPIKRLPMLGKSGDCLLLSLKRLVPPSTVHFLFWKLEHASNHVQPKAALEFLLVIYHVHKSSIEPKLHIKVGKVLGDGPTQPFLTRVYQLLCIVLAPLIFSFVDCL